MDQAFGEPHDGRTRRHGGGAERLVGAPEGEPVERRALLEAKTSGPNELIKALATDFGTSEGRTAARDGVQARLSGSKPAEIRDKAIAALREAAAIVDAKAPAEAGAFKDWLKQIAQKTAEASTEGGFLGFGGVQVSEAEKVTL